MLGMSHFFKLLNAFQFFVGIVNCNLGACPGLNFITHKMASRHQCMDVMSDHISFSLVRQIKLMHIVYT